MGVELATAACAQIRGALLVLNVVLTLFEQSLESFLVKRGGWLIGAKRQERWDLDFLPLLFILCGLCLAIKMGRGSTADELAWGSILLLVCVEVFVVGERLQLE